MPSRSEPRSGDKPHCGDIYLIRFFNGDRIKYASPIIHSIKRHFFPVIQRKLKTSGVRSAGLSIILLDGRRMRALNRQALGHDYITDVITFDLLSVKGPRIEAEIYICLAEAERNARTYGEPLERELSRYIAHGILHLLGYDDATEKQRNLMREQEDRLLDQYGDHCH